MLSNLNNAGRYTKSESKCYLPGEVVMADYKDMFDLKGQVAFVAGGAGGIGGACAMGLAQYGASIVIADSNSEGAEKTASEIRQQGAVAIAMKLDITDYAAVERACEETFQHFGKIDVLLNSVAVTIRKTLMELSPEEWNKIINVNLTSSYILSRVFGKEFIEKDSKNFLQARISIN